MSIVILDGIKGEHSIKQAICKQIEQLDETYEYFKLEELDIKPCRNCGGCAYKTPGECVVKDDMPDILRGILRAHTRIILSPVSFGGYNDVHEPCINTSECFADQAHMNWLGGLICGVVDFDRRPYIDG